MRLIVNLTITLLVAAGIVAGLYSWLVGPDDDQAANQTLPPPIDLLPSQPKGVTVLVKETESGGSGTSAPIAAGSAAPEGFAIDLGNAGSFSELSARFAEIGQINAELEFDRLEPRATIVETETGLQARLLVGPFATRDAAIATCDNIALPGPLECTIAKFRGALIARQ